ncbi:MAG: YtxH domain-containing protein [Tannerellaceae bacterium]
MKNLNVLVAFLGGTAVGTVLGLLFAPEKGENTRIIIAEKMKEQKGRLLSKKEIEELEE